MAQIDVRGFIEDRLAERCAATFQGRGDGTRVVVLAGDSAARREQAFTELVAKVPGRPRVLHVDVASSCVAPTRWPDAFRELHAEAHGRGVALATGLGLGGLAPALQLIESLTPPPSDAPVDAARLTALLADKAKDPTFLRLTNLDHGSYLWLSLAGAWGRLVRSRSLRLVIVAETGAELATDATNGSRPVQHQWLDDGLGGLTVVRVPSAPRGTDLPDAELPGTSAAAVLYGGALVGDVFPVRPVLDALGLGADADADAVVDALDDGLADDEDGAILADVGAKDHLWEPLMAYRFKDPALHDAALATPPADATVLAGRLADAVLRRLPRRGPGTTMLAARLRNRALQPDQASEVIAADLFGQPIELVEELDPAFIGAVLAAAPRPTVLGVAGWTAVRAMPPQVGLRLLDALDRALATLSAPPKDVRAMVLAGRAHCRCAANEGAAALEAVEAARKFATDEALGDWELPLLALHSRALLIERRLDEAERVARATIHRAEQLRQRSHVGRAKMEIATSQLLRKDQKAALQTLQEALGAFQQAGDKGGQADVHMQLAQAEVARQSPQKADEHFAKAAQLAREGNAPLTFVVAMRARGRMRLTQQGAAEAVQLLGPAAQAAGQIGQIPLAADILEDLASAAVLSNQAQQAQGALIESLRLRQAMQHVPGQARVLARLALAFVMGGDVAQASRAIDQSLSLQPDGEGALQCWQLRGMIALQQSRLEEAKAAVEQALRIAPPDAAQLRAQLMINLSLVLQRMGDEAGSSALRAEAQALAPDLQQSAGTMSITFPPTGGDGSSSTA